jgi:hypothetical protein
MHWVKGRINVAAVFADRIGPDELYIQTEEDPAFATEVSYPDGYGGLAINRVTLEAAIPASK